jgi:uncharacterized protein (DUF433 family)
MDSVRDNGDLLGRGVYTVPDAARLAGVNQTRIRRWLTGNARLYKGEIINDPPLWSPVLADIGGSLHLTFRDLIELRFVDLFRQQKISMPYLRKVVHAAQSLVGDSHPFSTSRFKTDGKKLYMELVHRTKEPELIEVLNGQHAFHSIISVGLKDIEFEAGVASRWFPVAGKGEVVVDPQRAFGQPILNLSGVPTDTIRMLAGAGRTPKEISADFELAEKSVKAALAFESQLAA